MAVGKPRFRLMDTRWRSGSPDLIKFTEDGGRRPLSVQERTPMAVGAWFRRGNARRWPSALGSATATHADGRRRLVPPLPRTSTGIRRLLPPRQCTSTTVGFHSEAQNASDLGRRVHSARPNGSPTPSRVRSAGERQLDLERRHRFAGGCAAGLATSERGISAIGRGGWERVTTFRGPHWPASESTAWEWPRAPRRRRRRRGNGRR